MTGSAIQAASAVAPALQQPSQRRIMLAAGVMAPIALAAPAIAQSLPEIRWRLPAASPPRALDITYSTSEYMCRMVNEITDGRFRITPFPAGELVPGLQAMDAVQAGSSMPDSTTAAATNC
jgi:TRAP-type mannitol/chloroaromatic compound transport system substrate-binding protein